MSTKCVNDKWFNIGETPPIPDCGSGGGECEDIWYQPELNARVLINEFDRPIDSVVINVDMTADNKSCNNIFIDAKLSGSITATGNITNQNQESDCFFVVFGDAGSVISSVKSYLKLNFQNKKGNVVLDGFFSGIQGTIENDLKLSYGTYVKLSGDLTVDRLVSLGYIETNGFNLTIKNL